ncbi:mitochondrial 2-oxoglutarate/malate carrier protein-like isoform X2 [Spodoptera litura]|uniref:Mitochondrial 2-oxoglutarate/malate carrier protein-like isoform X2 n=1 Tax=Spodoptera litura TaxID=69820 RepID=A0A9J7EP39_SPOLT|nr:mitochondrial 2-oxoglutarate/malate carrier protein-like isoform X2 [Spodoptera litura]
MANSKEVKKNQEFMPKWVNFLIGGVSGMLAICVVQPADLLKTRMQLLGPTGQHMSAFAVAKQILKKEGMLGFYTGISAALLRQATYTTARLGFFKVMFDIHAINRGDPTFPIKILMGMLAGGAGALIGNPCDVALVRMTADGRLPPEKRRNYKNVFDALGRIVREEGLFTLYRGAGATVSRAMVFNGAQLGSYSQAREMLLPHMGEGLPLHALSAMIAGFNTTVASLPVDIVKTRVQNSSGATSQVRVLFDIIKKEGFFALWSGMMPTYIRIGPMTILIFLFLEQFNALYFKLAARNS